MTMTDRENESISAVNTGCIPKVALVPVKTGEISTSESCLETANKPNEEKLCITNQSVIQQTMAGENSDLDSKPANEVVKAPTHHRTKHVRSFSDCTGLSSTSSDRRKYTSFIQVANVSENVQGISLDTIPDDSYITHFLFLFLQTVPKSLVDLASWMMVVVRLLWLLEGMSIQSK